MVRSKGCPNERRATAHGILITCPGTITLAASAVMCDVAMNGCLRQRAVLFAVPIHSAISDSTDGWWRRGSILSVLEPFPPSRQWSVHQLVDIVTPRRREWLRSNSLGLWPVGVQKRGLRNQPLPPRLEALNQVSVSDAAVDFSEDAHGLFVCPAGALPYGALFKGFAEVRVEPATGNPRHEPTVTAVKLKYRRYRPVFVDVHTEFTPPRPGYRKFAPVYHTNLKVRFAAEKMAVSLTTPRW